MIKKSSLTGWQDVYTFTLRQYLKSKAFIISYVILMVIMLVSMPIINILTSDNQKGTDSPNTVNKIYLDNKTSFNNLDLSGILNDEYLSHIELTVMDKEYDTVSQRIEDTEHESIIVLIAENEGAFYIELVRASDGPVKEASLRQIGDAINLQFEASKIKALGITSDQLNIINAEVTHVVTMTNTNGDPIIKEDDSISFVEYWFIYGTLFVILMVNMMASTQIATSIVTEKSTRVIEYLLISIKPLALIIGKILAMLTAVLLQMISMIIVLVLSNSVLGKAAGSGENVLTRYLPANIFDSINVVNVFLCLIMVVLGLIFYAALAGLTGATVSKLEEISEGLTLFTFISMIGAYIGLGGINTMMHGVNGYVIFTMLFPLSSPFVLPGAIMVGKASGLLIGGAILLQIIFIILLFRFVAKVFETLILHSGNKIKLNELIKMSKTT